MPIDASITSIENITCGSESGDGAHDLEEMKKMSHHSLLDSKNSSITDLPSVKGCACVSRAAHSGVSVNFDRVDGGVETCKGLTVPCMGILERIRAKTLVIARLQAVQQGLKAAKSSIPGIKLISP